MKIDFTEEELTCLYNHVMNNIYNDQYRMPITFMVKDKLDKALDEIRMRKGSPCFFCNGKHRQNS